MLWLDFGVFGEAYGRRLRASELAEWLRFCKDLSGHTPEDLRLVCSLSLEVDPAKFGAIEREVQVLAADLFDETFRCSLLPPLSEVREMDLLNFLSNPTSCNCPSLLVRDVARLIYERTAGGYAATVAMLERAESIGWHRLRDELRGGGPARA